MRILAIDYGTKRIGVAMSDPEGEFALPQCVIANDKNALTEIISLAQLNTVKTIVIGESKNYKGEDNKIMPEIMNIKKQLEDMGFELVLEPEFLSSIHAESIQGKNELQDASAAALILQRYLDRRK